MDSQPYPEHPLVDINEINHMNIYDHPGAHHQHYEHVGPEAADPPPTPAKDGIVPTGRRRRRATAASAQPQPETSVSEVDAHGGSGGGDGNRDSANRESGRRSRSVSETRGPNPNTRNSAGVGSGARTSRRATRGDDDDSIPLEQD